MKGAAEHEGRGNQPESAALLRALGAGLSPELLERALTHRSFAYENGGLPTNERLEFLGDAVLGLVVTDALFREYPDLPEGHLAKLRAAVVNMRALADVARDLHLGDYVRLGRGEEGTGGRDKASILADTLEAVIGPVHQKSFQAIVRVGGHVYGSGTGHSKKEAEQHAAEAAWSAISKGETGVQ